MVKNLTKFETEEECEDYIHKAPLAETIILISSEALAKNVVPCIQQQCQLAIIFIYHDIEEPNKQYFSKYKKVKENEGSLKFLNRSLTQTV